ncbi:MAG: SUMF1/EgtB/PvdO family nonheme iron enzyme [Anaerolineae bacterium]|nr:SUMF1/EgtB/PvdO family nonheme iron enzyme [Anaerolineae bacterium]
MQANNDSNQLINGRYRIQRKLGAGGMAVVYLAWDETMRRQVAVKRLYVIGASDDLVVEFRKRFEREAQAMAMVQHPHVVTSLDYGFDERGAYLVLEYLGGGNLRERMDGPMAVGEAVEIVRQLAGGLKYLHQMGLIHRDIKPENVLFDGEGRAYLADLGIVKLMEGGAGTTLTGTGVTVGTPAYMAPELVAGEVSPQVDQYALGVVLYEMVTGVKPFEGRTPMETMALQQTKALPDPRSHVPELPEAVCSVLRKMLAKQPGKRYADMAELITALEGLGSIQPRSGLYRVLSRASRVRNNAAGWILAGIAATALLVWLLSGGVNNGLLALRPTLTPTVARQAQETAAPSATPTTAPTMTVTPQPTRTTTPTMTATPTLGVGSTLIREKDGMPMMYVPAGTFAMGSYDGPQDEYPVHDVFLDAYWMDQYEVSNGQYEQCVAEGACPEPFSKQSYTRSLYYGTQEYADYPVVWVTWFHAATYCQWAGGRLPTEAEWEKAAKGTDGRRYPWGNNAPDCSYLNFQDYSETNNCVVVDTVAVGSYPEGASPYGVMDMAGNIYEWVGDWYSGSYYQSSPTENPTGPLFGNYRVIRGGYWSSTAANLRASTRTHLEPGSRWHEFGFRCVMDAN